MPGSDLGAALAAARFIASRPRPEAPDLYGGLAGLVPFHLELARATGDALWLEEARRGACALAPHVARVEDVGLYSGLAGIAFVLAETSRATGDEGAREAALRALATIHQRARRPRADDAYDVQAGSAGTGLFLLWAAAALGDARSAASAALLGRRLIAAAVSARGGLAWPAAPDEPVLYPGFAHGTAGVATFLARLHAATGERAFLDAALDGATHLEAIADRDEGGFRLPHHVPGGEDLFYVGWCHGPAGTALLFEALLGATGEERWRALFRACGTSVLASGAPERRSRGFWNNAGACCGSAAVGELFLRLDRAEPTGGWRAAARRAADHLVATAVRTDDAMCWPHAEHRMRPEEVVPQTGAMQGAAGIGSFFLHLHAAERGRAADRLDLPDRA